VVSNKPLTSNSYLFSSTLLKHLVLLIYDILGINQKNRVSTLMTAKSSGQRAWRLLDAL